MGPESYIRLLESIGQQLDRESEVLGFLADSTTIQSGMDFIHHLLDGQKIAVDNNAYLKDCLESVDRHDLVEMYFRSGTAELVEDVLTASNFTGVMNEDSLPDGDSPPESLVPPEAQHLFRDVHPENPAVINHDEILEYMGMNFQPYAYQRSLAAKAMKGINCIVALKTGGGKTHTAAYVAKFHYLKAQILQKTFKGVFVVPIRALVDQQKEVLNQAFPPKRNGPSRIGACHETGDFKEAFKQGDVVVCTAQVLINVLKKRTVAIQDISLLILDECHHTDKKHPYSRIMKMYRNVKYGGGATTTTTTNIYQPLDGMLPQTLGLSASLGADSKSLDIKEATGKATTKLHKMCQNLDATVVVFPEPTDRESLDQTNPDHGEDIVLYVPSRSKCKFREKLVVMAETIAATCGNLALSNLRVSGADINYEEVVKNLVLGERDAAIQGDSELQMAMIYVLLIVRALQHLELMRATDVLHFLQQKLEFQPDSKWILVSMEDNFQSVVKNKVLEMWSDQHYDLEQMAKEEALTAAPIVHRLHDLLIEKFAEPDARGILLSRSRFSTEALMNFIETSPSLKKLVRPGRLVGHSEMTDQQDKEVIQDLRDGKVNLLVATDVAQEGLDIPSCNFVIRYSFVSNEIGDVQAKGRARMPNAKRYSLIIRDSLEARLENKNRVLVQAMKNALVAYSQRDQDEWAKEVEKEQKKSYDEEVRKEVQERAGKEDPRHFVLICKGCSEHFVSAADMVKFNHHHIVNDFEEKYRGVMKTVAIPPEDQLSFPTETYTSHVYCVNCGSCVGKEIFVKVACAVHGNQVILSKDGIRCKRLSGEIDVRKFQWTKVPFWIRDIDDDDDGADGESLKNDDDDDAASFFNDFD